MKNERWSGRSAALVAALVLAPAAAWAQLGVSLGSNAARPVPNAAQAEAAPETSTAPAVGAASSRISQPSQASRPGQLPEALPASNRDTRPPTSLMGMSGTPPLGSVDLGAVLNTGSRIQRDNADKICPPGLVNRNNFCTPPATGLMTR